MTSQEHERERLNTKLLVQTLSPEGGLLPPHRGGRRDNEDGHRDDSPLRQGAGMGLDWFSVATEPCGGGTSYLGLPRRVSEYLGIYSARRGTGGH